MYKLDTTLNVNLYICGNKNISVGAEIFINIFYKNGKPLFFESRR